MSRKLDKKNKKSKAIAGSEETNISDAKFKLIMKKIIKKHEHVLKRLANQ
ncbi:MAG TPA: hypothetical protein VIJ14_00760 [Rhabdochlamydiaceae bacterium]